jgi:hypothetical protein
VIHHRLKGLVENDSCSVDAVRVVTGCTFGKGNLVLRDCGKHVYTFINRNTARSPNRVEELSGSRAHGSSVGPAAEKPCSRLFGNQARKIGSASENWQRSLTDAHVAYNVQDATITWALNRVLNERLQERSLELVYERERNALPVLRHLARNGMYLDAAAWQRDLARYKQEQAHLPALLRT